MTTNDASRESSAPGAGSEVIGRHKVVSGTWQLTLPIQTVFPGLAPLEKAELCTVEGVRKFWNLVNADKDLLPQDHLFLVVQGLCRLAEKRVFRIGKPVRQKDCLRCLEVAVEAVVRTVGITDGRWVGCGSRLLYPLSEATYRFARRSLGLSFGRWIGGRMVELDEADQKGVQIEGADLRALIQYRVQRERLGFERDWRQFDLAAVQALEDLEDGHFEIEKPERVALLQRYRFATRGTSGGVFIRRNGTMCLNSHELRDFLAANEGHRRLRGPRRSSRLEGGDANVFAVEDSAEQAVEAAESADLVREILAIRAAQAEKGTPEWHVLKNFDRLILGSREEGGVSLRRLEKEVGCSYSSLQRAMTAIVEVIVVRM